MGRVIAGILALDIIVALEVIPRAHGWLSWLGVAVLLIGLGYITYRVGRAVAERLPPRGS